MIEVWKLRIEKKLGSGLLLTCGILIEELYEDSGWEGSSEGS